MTMDPEQEQPTRTIPWAEMFDHADPPMWDDLGPSLHPDDRSSAARIGAHVERQRQEAAKARAKLAAEIRQEIEDEKNANPYRGIPTAQLHGRAYLRRGRGQDQEGNER
jgi:hypothetical protein